VFRLLQLMSGDMRNAQEVCFDNWLRLQGVLHKSCGVGHSSKRGRYAIAVNDIAAGEVVIQVLHSLLDLSIVNNRSTGFYSKDVILESACAQYGLVANFD
jgi:hypothetical protein